MNPIWPRYMKNFNNSDQLVRSRSSFWVVTSIAPTYHVRITPSQAASTILEESAVASDLGLEQMVDFPIRVENTPDLIFTSHPSFQERCKPLLQISGKSDHDIVLFLYISPTGQSQTQATDNLIMGEG